MQLQARGANARLLDVLAGRGPVTKRTLLTHTSVSDAAQSSLAQNMHQLRKAGYIEERVHLTAAGLKALHSAKARATC